MVYSHCTGLGPGQVQGTGPAQWETMDHGSFPCLGPVGIFLYYIQVPLFWILFPAPVTVPIPSSVNNPLLFFSNV